MKFVGYVMVKLNSQRIPCSDESIKEYIESNLSYTFIKRPSYLDSDNILFNEVLQALINWVETDYMVFLCCTSPFIKPTTIHDMVGHIINNGFDSAFTAFAFKNFDWFNDQPLNYDPSSNIPRTQDLKPIIIETSGLYVFSKELFEKYNI